MTLSGRHAVITGANRGFGLEVARAFVREGASALVCARDGGKLQEAARELESMLPAGTGQRVVAVRADVARDADAAAVVGRAIETFGRVDILVNNAGVYGPKGCVDDVDAGEWVHAITVNLFGPFYLMRHLLPHMKRNGYGKIINLSGGGATAPLPRISAYAASKAALVRLTETVAEEVKASGIDVNAIAPGALNTRLLDEVLAAGPERVGQAFYDRAVAQKRDGGAPLTRGAALTVYLASAASDGITGRLISAVWDPWPQLHDRRAALAASDIYTLRRIVPADRGQDWEGGRG